MKLPEIKGLKALEEAEGVDYVLDVIIPEGIREAEKDQDDKFSALIVGEAKNQDSFGPVIFFNELAAQTSLSTAINLFRSLFSKEGSIFTMKPREGEMPSELKFSDLEPFSKEIDAVVLILQTDLKREVTELNLRTKEKRSYSAEKEDMILIYAELKNLKKKRIIMYSKISADTGEFVVSPEPVLDTGYISLDDSRSLCSPLKALKDPLDTFFIQE